MEVHNSAGRAAESLERLLRSCAQCERGERAQSGFRDLDGLTRRDVRDHQSRPAVAIRTKNEPPTIRRPTMLVVEAHSVGELAKVRTIGVHDTGVRISSVAVRIKRDLTTIRRPLRPAIEIIGVGQTRRGSASLGSRNSWAELIEAREDLRDADPLIGWQIVTRAELGIDRGQLGVEARLIEHVFRWQRLERHVDKIQIADVDDGRIHEDHLAATPQRNAERATDQGPRIVELATPLRIQSRTHFPRFVSRPSRKLFPFRL